MIAPQARFMRRFGHVLATAVWLGAMAPLAADEAEQHDVVVLRRTGDERGELEQLRGDVLEHNGAGVGIKLTSGLLRSVEAGEVQSVLPRRGAAHLEADRLFAARQYDQALARYVEASQQESRPWVQREILAQAVWCYRSLGQWETAAETFLRIVRNDPETPHWQAVPLVWWPQQPTEQRQRMAIQWLDVQQQPAARLIGASWLLSTAEGPRARAALDVLAVDARSRSVAKLAAAQLWRTRIVTADAAEVTRWRETIANWPFELRAGATFVVGQALGRREDHRQAALTLMQVPTLYPRHEQLGTRALLAAAAELERVGECRDAAALLREVIARDNGGAEAAEARTRLERIGTESGSAGAWQTGCGGEAPGEATTN